MGWKISLVSAHTSTLLSLLALPLSLWMVASMGGPGGGAFAGMMPIWMLLSIPLRWVGGFIWYALLCLVLLPGVSLSQRAIGEPIGRGTTAWLAGSAVSMVGSLGGLLQLISLGATASLFAGGFAWLVGGQLIFAVVRIAAAQAGGYLGSLSGLRRRRVEKGQRVGFSVWRLLAITAILAVLLSVVRLAGEFAVPILGVLALNTGVAWAIHRPVAWLTNKWLDWRLKKRRAKRQARSSPHALLAHQAGQENKEADHADAGRPQRDAT